MKLIPIYVSRVIDGDTLVTSNNEYVRLAGVNAPELNQLGGRVARTILENQVIHRILAAQQVAIDAYGRFVCHLWLDGQSVNERMRRLGYH